MYTKPGPGVDKNAPEKRRIWQFFEIFFGQLSKLSVINMIYFVAMLPLVLGLWLCFRIDFSSPSILVLRVPGTLDLIGFILLIVSVFVSFPATAGFTYVIRNIQRREHAWMWHDFKKHIRANYKKGVINGAVTLVLYYLLINAHGLYLGQYVFPSATLNTVFSVVMMLLIVLFTWSQFYVNTMIVTFDLKMRDIYKNAFLFAISSAPRNLLVSIICLILGFGVYVLFLAIPPLAILLAFLILYSLFGFITVFTIYPTIDKYMIAVAPNKKADTEGEI